MTILTRRRLITGLLSSLAAPAIVRAGSIMPISGDVYRYWTHRIPLLPPIIAAPPDLKDWLGPNGRLYIGEWTFFGNTRNIFSDEVVGFRRFEAP